MTYRCKCDRKITESRINALAGILYFPNVQLPEKMLPLKAHIKTCPECELRYVFCAVKVALKNSGLSSLL